MSPPFDPPEIRKIAVIGLGYVGLPLAVSYAESGCRVYGIDTDPQKPVLLRSGKSYIGGVSDDQVNDAVRSGTLHPLPAIGGLPELPDAFILCVPTPLTEHLAPDLTFVLETGRSIGSFLATWKGERNCVPLIVLESTTYPGTTEEELLSILEQESGGAVGVDFHLGYSPEREDPGRREHSVRTIPKLISGLTPSCLQRVRELYSVVNPNLHEVSSCRVAEAAKLLENIFRAVNIALVNELKVLYDRMGIDVFEVIDAASTKPFGFMRFDPGPGLGGHCIPIDPFYLTWKAREVGMTCQFIEWAGIINRSMPAFVVQKLATALNAQSRCLRGTRVLLLGMAYKPDVGDYREAPSLQIMRLLEEQGAVVQFHDPHVPELGRMREYPEYVGRRSVDDIVFGEHDAMILITHHERYRSLSFAPFAGVFIDTRDAVSPSHRPNHYFKA